MVQTTKQVMWWGNSLGVRIPKDAAARAGISHGSSIHIKAEPGKITLIPSRTFVDTKKIPRYSLKKLLRGVTPKNLNRDEEFMNAPSVGREII